MTKTPPTYSILLISALTAAALTMVVAADRSTYWPTIKKVDELDDGSLKITYTVLVETMYHCPGAKSKTTDDGIELSFVRASFRKRPEVDHPAKKVKKDGKLEWVITVPAPSGKVWVRQGKKLAKLYPEGPEA